MEVFGRIVYVFTYIWILLCIDISNSLKEGTNLTVCAGNEASFYSELSNTSTVFIIVFKKGINTIGTYQPEKGIIIDAEFKDRYSIVKKRYGITLNINGTQVLDQGRFICEITYITGPDVIKELHLIVKEKENSSLIMFEKIVQGSNTFITCHANRGRVKLKMPDKTTKTCSCCFIEQCSEDVCKTLTLDEFDVDHLKEDIVHKKIFVTVATSLMLIILIMFVITSGIILFRNKKRIRDDVRNKRKSQLKPVYEYTTGTDLNAEIFSCGCTSNEEDVDEKSVIVLSGCTSNEEDMDYISFKVLHILPSDLILIPSETRSGSRDDTGTYIA